MKNTFLLLLIFFSFNSFAQKKHERVKIEDKVLIKNSVDSLVTAKINSSYIETLEKVNSQVNLASNPFSYFITALGVLFTILAIFTTISFYFQSQDFKNQREKVFEEVNEKYQNEIVKMNKSFDDKQKLFEALNLNLLNSLKQNFEKVLTPVQNSDFLKNIDLFEKSIRDLNTFQPNTITVKVFKEKVANQFGGSYTSEKLCKCCSKIYYRRHLDSQKGYNDVIKSVCPHCFNYEEEQKINK